MFIAECNCCVRFWMPAFIILLAMASGYAQEQASALISPGDARIRERGNLREDGTFSFWTNGVIGDWFIAAREGDVTVAVYAAGKTLKGVSPSMALELISSDGDSKEVGRFSVVSFQYKEYHLDIAVEQGFFGLRLRHLNRVADKNANLLRHLLLKRFSVSGARRSDSTLTEYIFFGSRESREQGRRRGGSEKKRVIATNSFQVEVDPQSATWSVQHKGSGCKLEGVRPLFHIKGFPVNLTQYKVSCAIENKPNGNLGHFTAAKLLYKKEDALEIAYTLLISDKKNDIITQVDFVNNTGRALVIRRVAPMVVSAVALGGKTSQWTAIGDGKANNEPYNTVKLDDMKRFECWWYAAIKNRTTGHSVLVGSLTNNKGLGRFLLLPSTDAAIRLAAYSDYEGIVMPPGSQIVGEKMLLNFGQRGVDSLDRFGELIAKAHSINLMEQHPINPYVPESLSLFTTWNSYGSAVVRGFDYKHDRTNGKKAYMDPEWRMANQRKLRELGLHKYGYAPVVKIRISGAPTPLVRRYGNPDFWFKEAEQIAKEHPEYYINGCIDFSNPAVLDFERRRVHRAFKGVTSILRYNWDFTNRCRKLPGQHNPFMTSAETYRAAMGIWRDFARRHAPGAYAFIWMNVVGINYDICDVIHIGADSDQGYYGKVCTFTQGLTRQISGRYFYNGKVWWNSPDSFHVYVGGLYSYNQGKVHASFCAIAGNLVHLAEPFSDEDIPEDRLEIIRRCSPTTPDVSKAVDVFEHNPARLWNMPIKREFGEWNVVGLFNFDYKRHGKAITQEISFDDLELSPEKEYLVYELWSKKFLGVKKGSFTRTLHPPDCEIYSVVEKKEHPVLISTNRHVRQMAYDILDLKWDDAAAALSGTSKLVENDPYQLRIFVPEDYAFVKAEAGELAAKTKAKGAVLTVGFKAEATKEVDWTVLFRRLSGDSGGRKK